jgi:hypothetical protein
LDYGLGKIAAFKFTLLENRLRKVGVAKAAILESAMQELQIGG